MGCRICPGSTSAKAGHGDGRSEQIVLDVSRPYKVLGSFAHDSGWQYKQYVRVAGSPPHGTLIDPKTGVYRPGMCRLFSRPYPTSVSGDLHSFLFNWNTSQLTVTASPSVKQQNEAEIVISVTEEDEWGWDGEWTVLSVTKDDGERIGTKRVEKEQDLDHHTTGVRWWVERAWVEGSKLVKVRLGHR